jgi:hypothetical protein
MLYHVHIHAALQKLKYWYMFELEWVWSAQSDSYDILYEVKGVMNIMKKFKKVYNPRHDLALHEAMIFFKGCFAFKQ